MDKIRIMGGRRLSGTIAISGAKNAALPLMAACLLTKGTLTLKNLPHLMDITTMVSLLTQHGATFTLDGSGAKGDCVGGVIALCADNINNLEAPYEVVRKMRASVLVLGPLLARFGKAKVSLPGGCAIGTRPVDIHLDALKKMGATISIKDGYIHAEAAKGKLHGADIAFPLPSVGATENLMMAATLAEGQTTLRNVAKEPEIIDLAACLCAMGAKIKGAGTSTIIIQGSSALSGAEHTVIPDRIEAGTYAAAALASNGEIELQDICTDHMASTLLVLEQMGGVIKPTDRGFVISQTVGTRLKPVDVTTEPYPGFPTDMQAQIMALQCCADGTSHTVEAIFENRFMHVAELMRMGADITINGNIVTVNGVKQLEGASVMATDLRASVCLVIAGLGAEGETLINRVYHIDRGYERIEEKLSACGAKIERTS
jgi:UDP-N-acetylglucosamine 1-carboxyvinyltransferase